MSNCQVPMPVYSPPEPMGELVDALKRENDALRAAADDKDALIMTLNEDIAAWRTISRNAFHKLIKTNELVRDLWEGFECDRCPLYGDDCWCKQGGELKPCRMMNRMRGPGIEVDA